jgi:DNA polymerase III alpha subunit
MKETFCRRHRGLEADAFHHPDLVPVLGATHGVMLYEEDVMRVAAALAGLSLAEGDDLRRALATARDDEEFRSLERGFVAACAGRGVGDGRARAVWRDLTRFAAYAFCKAHAAGYGALGWQSAWFKTHFPAEWAVGILNHHAGMYSAWVHVEDLRRRGVEFRAPHVNHSRWETTLECDRGRDPAVRVGLGRVFGLAEATGERVVAARAGRPFRTLADLVDRVRPTLPELESLVFAGALDFTGRTRPALLLEARVGASPLRPSRPAPRAPALAASDGTALAPEPVSPVAVPDLPEFDLAERVRGECRATGLWFSAHPLDVLVPAHALDPRRPGSGGPGTVPAAGLHAHAGRRVALTGLPCAYRRVETKSGGAMLFLTLADRSGLAECVLFPDALRRHARDVRAQVVRVEGRVDRTLDAVTLTVERAAALA